MLRYFLKYENEEEYLRALCILFLPFRNEKSEIHNKDIKALYELNKYTIEERRNKFEKHKEIVEVIREVEANKEDLDEENIYLDEETTTHEEIADFEKHVKQQAKKVLTKFSAKDYL